MLFVQLTSLATLRNLCLNFFQLVRVYISEDCEVWEQSPSSDTTNSLSASQEILRHFKTLRFITVFKKASLWPQF